MRTYLQSAGCTTGAGKGITPFFQALVEGRTCVENGAARIARAPGKSNAEQAVSWLCEALAESGFEGGERTGVILSSTKGEIEDALNREGDWAEQAEPLAPLLDRFLSASGLRTTRQAVVSNACASSHGALFLARHWIEAGLCDTVVIAAADLVGNFIEKGFRSLQAVCSSTPQPFARERDGLALGEGAAVLILSARPSPWELETVSLVTEGIALTRPSAEGAGLERACREAGLSPSTDLIIAHGTGTLPNDAAEARVFAKLAPAVPVTGTKWCIGHTLGASGALDLIAAMEVLRHQIYFGLGTTERVDPSFTGNFLTRDKAWWAAGQKPRRIVISSLGFGGMNAALTVTGGGTA